MATRFGGYGGFAYAGAAYAAKDTTPVTTVTSNPFIEVDVAFTTNPNAAQPAWVEVTPDMRKLEITRGRSQSPLDKFQPGTCVVTLDNRARRYDPIYTGAGAPYNGNIKPLKRMRVIATQAGITYPVFDGYANAWDQEYEMPREARAILRATDGFMILNNKVLPNSVWEAWIRADGRYTMWYRLGEPSGATTVSDESSNAYTGTVVGAPSRASAVPVKDSNGSYKFDGSTQYIQPPQAAVITSNVWTVEMWLSLAAFQGTNAGQVATAFCQGGSSNNINIGIRGSSSTVSPGRVQVNCNGTSIIGSTNQIAQDRVHIMVVSDGSGNDYLYVDGVLENVKNTTNVAPDPTNMFIARLNPVLSSTSYFPGIIDEVIVYNNVALSAADALNHYQAGATPLLNQTPQTRINQILNWITWPNTYVNVDQGNTTLDATALSGSALQYLQKVEETEEGYLFMDRAGNVRFKQRHNTQNQTIRYTFGDSGTELGYTALTFDYSDTLLRNEIRCGRDGGTVRIAKDVTSQNSYGPRGFDRTVQLHALDSSCDLQAAYLLSLYKDVTLRIVGMTVEAYADATNLLPAVLSLEIGDWIIVNRRPQGVGSVISQTCVVHGIKHSIVPKRWTTTFVLSPIGTNVFWQLGVAGFSELGTHTTLGW